MNQKANVSKELNAKHRKILEGLLKLPENRECADCKNRAPRWASVNLGIFICMQCSGIHRSLGVHISKVRSTTLDTWLPEQITFIQSMGNDKSNSYWEAELPPNYGRVGMENFIRAKYEEKRWIPRDKAKSPPRVDDKKASVYRQGPRNYVESYTNRLNHASERNIAHPPITNGKIPVLKSTSPSPVEGSPLVSPNQKLQKPVHSTEPAIPKAEHEVSATQVVTPPKVDYATDLFNLLSMEDPKENSFKTSADYDAWAGFQSAEAISTAETSCSSNSTEDKLQLKYVIEDQFIESPSVVPYLSEKTQKDVKNDIMTIFEKSNMVSPFSIHQQQRAMLSQQHTFLMAASTKSGVGTQTFPANLHQPTAYHLPIQNLASIGHQVPGMMMPMADLQKYALMGNSWQARPVGNSVVFPTSSVYTAGPVAPINGVMNIRPSSASPVPLITPTQTAKDSDFSSLTQGMFKKR
ncbi:ArfGap domain-containing protein [Cephalotus follicularis]|uniref:ArfGap domain-containing protein n=1 Tax=Cephalotus follicularis TaxID=3775 RepID=A0A1Q3AVA2_CEPFO|nr:ArfGap domain-containing protein [Cephalotus follicularis]